MTLGRKRGDVRLLMTIPGINVYSAVAIVSKIDNITRFRSKEKFVSCNGINAETGSIRVQSHQGHVSKHWPSLLRFVLVSELYSVIKYLEKMRKKHMTIVRRTGMKMTIVAIARILAETVYTMISRNKKFLDSIDSLTEKKITAMSTRAKRAANVTDISAMSKLLKSQKFEKMSEEHFS